KTTEVAIPEAFVVAVFTAPAKDPLAPVPGAVKVTTAPATVLPLASLTVATRGALNAAFTCALCGVPLVAVTEAAGPALFVSAKFAVPATPETEAVTL